MLIYQCEKCQQQYAKVVSVCAKCLCQKLIETEVSDEGELVTWTTIRRAPAGFSVNAPYDVVVVDLICGLRVTGRLAQESIPPTMYARVKRIATEEGSPIFIVMA